MRHILLACAAALTLSAAASARAETPTPAAAPTPKYSSSTTQMGTLLADPAAKAVLVKHLPRLVENPDMAERASGMTLKDLQDALKAYAPDLLSDEVLAKIDADLAALPAG
jgi:hypothetical protein